jgi:hypothetical protein
MQRQAVPRTWQHRVLCFLLRWVGGVSLLALVPVFMPYEWMDEIHRSLGMGTLPSMPVVGYLARSLSLFYALMGGLLIFYSLDLLRHNGALRYLGFSFVFFGLVVLGIDYAEGMPRFWKQLEGPYVTLFGVLILVLLPRINHKTLDMPQ